MGKRIFLNLDDAKMGVHFLYMLTVLRQGEAGQEGAPITGDFVNNSNIVAQMPPFSCNGYADLSSGAKSFISRCASHKRYNPDKTLNQIVREQYLLIQHESDRLYHEVMLLMDQADQKSMWSYAREEMLAEWYALAEHRPLHMYHPDDLSDYHLYQNVVTC